MKKALCLLLSFVMVFSITGVAFAKKTDKNETPVIIIPGFMQTTLLSDNEKGETEKVWLPDFLKKLDIIGKSLPEILLSFVSAIADKPEKLGAELMELINDLAPKMVCNPDGTSVHPVYHLENDPAKRNMAFIKGEKEKPGMQAYYTFANYICDEGYTDADNVFIFEYDGRMDALFLAENLRDFIKDVKAYTGKDKVRLFGVSYGGQIAETYLHFYMNDKDVEKAVFNVPSFGGTNFGHRILNGSVEFALDDVMDIIESITGSDTEFNRILKDVDPEFFSRTLNGIMEGIRAFAKYWGSVYSLTSVEYYDELKNQFLDEKESAEIIRRNDIIHYEVMPKVGETLRKCMDEGIYIAVHAASGLQLALGGEENSDLLLSVKDVTGATTTLFGERYKDGYKGAGTACSDKSHNHISPSGEVDASTAYLPENTWFVDGQHHAMFQYENYGLNLAAKTLCTDELKDVHSDPDYPQFRASDNPHRGVYAEFDSSTSGFISKKDGAFIIENTYKNNKIRILSVTVKGAEVSFHLPFKRTLSPGEKLKVGFDGDFTKAASSKASVKVKYVKLDNISHITDRKFDFTVLKEYENDDGNLTVKNELYCGDTSGMPVLKRAAVTLINILDIIFVLIDFIGSDAFRYLL